MNERGRVWLVGAGPGDAGLLTVRGRELLRRADVVVYDRLVGAGVLGLIPPGAKLIGVGKTAGSHPVPQEEICRILVREARAGLKVVRLKGGDPFLFGRGGEELEALREAGIPCEVVPGVPSAIAVPAYAGIPVTNRGDSASLHIFTGHRARGGAEELDFPVLAKLPGTLVFLMGVEEAPRICAGLLAAGMDKATPAAAIEAGTTARQKTAAATLATLPREMERQRILPPAVVVIGAVAALPERLAWAGCRPLDGRRVVVTRPSGKNEEFCAKIRALGGEAIPCPCIETAPLQNAETAGLPDRLGKFAWIAFSSAAGVEAFFALLQKAGLDGRALAGAKIAAVGGATAGCLAAHGVLADLIPARFDGGHLGAAIASVVKADAASHTANAEAAGKTGRVLVLRARDGARALEERLGQEGVPFEAVPLYETRPVAEPAAFPELRSLIEGGEYDLLAFASPSAARAFAAAFPHAAEHRRTAVCIGAGTVRAAESLGFPAVRAETATEDGMLEAMVRLPGEAARQS